MVLIWAQIWTPRPLLCFISTTLVGGSSTGDQVQLTRGRACSAVVSSTGELPRCLSITTLLVSRRVPASPMGPLSPHPWESHVDWSQGSLLTTHDLISHLWNQVKITAFLTGGGEKTCCFWLLKTFMWYSRSVLKSGFFFLVVFLCGLLHFYFMAWKCLQLLSTRMTETELAVPHLWPRQYSRANFHAQC